LHIVAQVGDFDVFHFAASGIVDDRLEELPRSVVHSTSTVIRNFIVVSLDLLYR
jgi:hypothetical protein